MMPYLVTVWKIDGLLLLNIQNIGIKLFVNLSLNYHCVVFYRFELGQRYNCVLKGLAVLIAYLNVNCACDTHPLKKQI
jgi:hypothetical protein